MNESEKAFLVKAQIPVVESDGFANEIRKATSGQANPNLRFSHFEVIYFLNLNKTKTNKEKWFYFQIVTGDPFYVPDSDEEDDDPSIIESALRASKLMKEVRRRKGLPVDDHIVVHAEKQRTLNKKK